MNRLFVLPAMGAAACLWLGYLTATGPTMIGARADTPAEPPPILKAIQDARPALPETGNTTGSATIVEFFDYRCPYCEAMQPRLQKLLAEDKRIHLIFADWPVFGGVSIYAARVAIASNWQGRYLPVHDALFTLGKGMTEASVRTAAQGAGIDLTRLDADLTGRAAEIDGILSRTNQEAHALGFEGTPGFIIGNAVVPGALSSDDIKAFLK